MDSELDRTYNPFERNEEFEQFLDSWLAQQPDPEEKTDARLNNRPEF